MSFLKKEGVRTFWDAFTKDGAGVSFFFFFFFFWGGGGGGEKDYFPPEQVY